MPLEFEDNRLKVKEALFDAGKRFYMKRVENYKQELLEIQGLILVKLKALMNTTLVAVLWQVNSMDKLEVTLKMLFGKNLEQVNMRYMVMVGKAVGCIKHQRVNFISRKVRNQIDRCIMPLLH